MKSSLRLLPAAAVAFIACAKGNTSQTDSASMAKSAPAAAAAPAPGSNEALIASAESAAPASIAKNANVIKIGDDGKVQQIRAGTNGWTCAPDDPSTPGPDPICADAEWMEWFNAWMAHKPYTPKVVGLAYMLQGSSDASDTDPYKMKPDSGQQWMTSPPHVMLIYPDAKSLASIKGDRSAGGPWVMFRGTPYAHVMVPISK